MPRNWRYGKKKESGYRSKLEEQVAKSLTDRGVKFSYESILLYYDKKVGKGLCLTCKSKKVVSRRSYKPDFILDNGRIIEVKGRLTSTDRTKMVAVKEANPDKLICLYFATNNKIHKNSETRYDEWATKHGFDFSVGSIPRRWLTTRKVTESGEGNS